MTVLGRTLKLRLYPNTIQAQQLLAMSHEYQRLANLTSQWVFDHDFPLSPLKINHGLYQIFRQTSPLNSQMIQSVFRTVVARYRTVLAQMKQHPYHYQDENGKWVQMPKDLTWLFKPIHFSRPQADLVRNSNYSFVNDSTKISLTTLGKRTKMSFTIKGFEQYFQNGWKLGTARLVHSQGKWALHIGITKEVADFAVEQQAQIVGIDRGLRFLATTYDRQGKTLFFSGQKILLKRKKFLENRRRLQSKGTKSAKKKLKQLAQRENRWMADVNHQVSKTLVAAYGPHTLFVLEDLTNITFNTDDLPKSLRNSHRSWSFFQLESFLIYKAQAMQSTVVKVSPTYTSQRCPKCGLIERANRHHETHEYHCRQCQYRSNDDRLGAMNIALLGQKWLSGVRNPKIKKITTTG
ncbi:RNA-guided endonuclease TnpB family protein [Levilactobacillus tujiorum]|uniref:IS200/IS605 family element transposase accessory protein TnpB n=1 Tax=Levilactobacillus tujiorum TaxID=2912243 RepID=A0ABX1L3K1_9LACO|nr:RNA-guided endonuclease TnpB family protein [Levilactobacillus tujiorum]MCH5464628.1 transposase [Levilactobacillus tujiorum]NLR11690.1 IS200/IS605 family element transposase accessory protein TnpB [Lactobacillus sp. HBUAS51387]NLR29611.1 IS200/IS605 family element transposase accessory protein TnpB [Levilactobacillus tujiorum]